MAQRQTHPRRQAGPETYCDRWIPGRILGRSRGLYVPSCKTLTPIVGDSVVYTTWAGDILHPDDARKRLETGQTVYYTTWETLTPNRSEDQK